MDFDSLNDTLDLLAPHMASLAAVDPWRIALSFVAIATGALGFALYLQRDRIAQIHTAYAWIARHMVRVRQSYGDPRLSESDRRAILATVRHVRWLVEKYGIPLEATAATPAEISSIEYTLDPRYSVPPPDHARFIPYPSASLPIMSDAPPRLNPTAIPPAGRSIPPWPGYSRHPKMISIIDMPVIAEARVPKDVGMVPWLIDELPQDLLVEEPDVHERPTPLHALVPPAPGSAIAELEAATEDTTGIRMRPQSAVTTVPAPHPDTRPTPVVEPPVSGRMVGTGDRSELGLGPHACIAADAETRGRDMVQLDEPFSGMAPTLPKGGNAKERRRRRRQAKRAAAAE